MKTISLVARLLLGLVFLVFGLNGFLNFIHAPMPGGAAGSFLGAMFSSHYLYLVAGTQLLCGLFLIADLFVPLALALLAPVLANILTYHLTMQREGLPIALAVAVLWAISVGCRWSRFKPLFAAKG